MQLVPYSGLDEVRRIAEIGLASADGRQQRHGDLGEVVEHEEVDVAVRDQLRGRHRCVSPEAAGAADADAALVIAPGHCRQRSAQTGLLGQPREPQAGDSPTAE